MITCPLCQRPVIPVPSDTSGTALLFLEDGDTGDFECLTMINTSQYSAYKSHFTRYRAGFHKPAYGLFVPAYHYTITMPPFQFNWNSFDHQCRVYELSDHSDDIKEQHTMSSLEAVLQLAKRLNNLKAFL